MRVDIPFFEGEKVYRRNRRISRRTLQASTEPNGGYPSQNKV